MGFQFKKATKARAKLRAALVGPSGAGKTYTALTLASFMGKRIAVIDSERGSASKYADKFSFDVVELESFEPATYVAAIHDAENQGFDIIIVDSLSHAWMGKGGALEMVDKAAARSKSSNSFAAWREVTPEHNALVEAMVTCKAHIIVTMRAKTEYVIEENERGKKVPRKIGIAPVQRDGLEYEFDVVADLDHDLNFCVTKTRCDALSGYVAKKAGAKEAAMLKAWLEDGVEPPVRVAPPAPASGPKAVATPVPPPGNGLDRIAQARTTISTATLEKLDEFEKAKAKIPKHIWDSVAADIIERRRLLLEQAEAEKALAARDQEMANVDAELAKLAANDGAPL